MSTWFGIILFAAILGFFIWGMWRDYIGRPRKLWLSYSDLLPELNSTPANFELNEIWATVGEIGYAEFLGVPAGRFTRDFHLYINLLVCQEGLLLRVSGIHFFQNVPAILIPWGRVESIQPMENDWGTPGIGIKVNGMPPQADPNHIGTFLVWLYTSLEQLPAFSEKVHSYLAT
ncbi:autophagy-related protein 27 [Geothrix mesophila]|uniref:autophagy-related protein 27 n=1 Tax=Geothrix mesophila TaxID=2922723 RepID=UPI001FAC3590|nr:autophagy-related protein 27 [Geothrix sp. SG198]